MYLRESPGLPTIKAQKLALGLDKVAEDDPVYMDLNPKRRRATPAEPYPELALAIRALRPEDELAVSGPEVLGGSDGQILEIVQAVGAKQAALYDATADKVIAWEPKALDVLAWIKLGSTRNREASLRKARVKRAELGRGNGAVPKLTGKAKDAALKIWLNPELTGNQAAEQIGVSPSTAYRKLGSRDQPIFGRKVKP